MPEIPRKWTWDGELFVKSNQDFADRLCNVRFEDVTDVSGDGFKFDVLMDGKDSIRFDRLYSMFEMRTILRGLRRVDQFASMCHTGPPDRDALLTLKTFMRDKNLVSVLSSQYMLLSYSFNRQRELQL